LKNPTEQTPYNLHASKLASRQAEVCPSAVGKGHGVIGHARL
jgi:hypothetical protein